MQPDEFYMARAIELARRGRFTTAPNPNVGCVIVRERRIVGEGYHLRAGEPHAEVHALRMAGDAARGATAYVTLEPCSHYGRTPPCCDALIAAGVARVVVAMQDPNPQVSGRGMYRLQQAGVVVEHGLMIKEAERLNLGFLKRMRTGFPYVQLKLAASLDGRTAMASGESQWITSTHARRDVQTFRAQSGAILSTSATVLADNPALNVRWDELPETLRTAYPRESLRQPTRVIIDSANRVTPAHRVVSPGGQIWLARLYPDGLDWPQDVEQLILPARGNADSPGDTPKIDLVALMLLLAQRQVNSLWVEAGASLAGALLGAGLVDEVILYLAPKLLGSGARGLCMLPGLETLAQAPEFTVTDLRQVGPDIRLRLKPCYPQ
ncbi:bifunctional diaminohydroxyphosphoribosylaminopyrimidine deaminase/5-amino-6-(5-phosphoribosylamino)uracil reductase RibD [Acerihabitans sp. TG2]|uniref:bifunctional diaminohydroxyphosphoribosylaminopyrimidine deaminase/5-amino-6-(5-phosphoribosylamino)uracil reductase RibD n=1 Tax=Acerihabitans sp. TG2 TaxID=3096008 RepID=UPI002B22B482|nr:bifunctional diaminohydroxyphosphoribosylaminopyrimidine deaminase/5-amino-6-(5-phosphoribosylamino)uracil reductase RibD [Acerihabitans sp. TG2]MEA9390780.1 bifunctional diaminohydroxyphosphoribosylaminopyrimidine deaminase/5-amino-6-(5-phosphoribosylamino)uracil reductase RibD [Acerihabitans sp. TG2]